MKKMIAFLCACLLCSSTLFAQEAPSRERGWEIESGLAFFPYFNILFPYALTSIGHKSPDDGLQGKADFELPLSLDLGVRYRVTTWFQPGVSIELQRFSGDKTRTKKDGDGNPVLDSNGNEVKEYMGRHSLSVAALMPGVRFNYMNRPKCTLYGEAYAGAAYYLLDKNCRSENSMDRILFSFQVTPIGVTFGSDLFGFFEAGAGSQWIGVQGGIGYRF